MSTVFNSITNKYEDELCPVCRYSIDNEGLCVLDASHTRPDLTPEGKRRLPEKIAGKVYQWLGVHDVLHFWEQDETWFIVAKADDSLCFLRLFPLGGEYVLSQDSIKQLDAKEN